MHGGGWIWRRGRLILVDGSRGLGMVAVVRSCGVPGWWPRGVGGGCCNGGYCYCGGLVECNDLLE